MERILRGSGAAVLAVFAVVAFTPLANRLYPRITRSPGPGRAEAIVVLGSAVGPDGVLGDESLRRAVHGIALYRRGLAPHLLLLGTHRAPGVVEAEVRARLAGELGVPAEAIITEPGARTTREEAALGARTLFPRGARRILLVTGSHHMARARALFEKAGFEVLAAPVDEVSAADDHPGTRLKLARLMLAESLAWLYHRAAGYL